MKSLFCSAFLAAGLFSTARAQNLPNYDPDVHCRKVAAFGGQFSETTMNACMHMEQDAYNQVKPEWPEVPAATRSHCDQVAKFGGEGDYMTLKACISMEADAAKKNQAFQFQR